MYQVVEMTDEEKFEMYMKISHEELVRMKIEEERVLKMMEEERKYYCNFSKCNKRIPHHIIIKDEK